MRKFLIILIILLLIGGIGYVAWQNMSDGGEPGPIPIVTPTPIVEEKTLADEVLVETVEVNSKKDNKYVDCKYPKIKSFKNASMQNYINSEISNNIIRYVQEIDYVIDDLTKPEEMYRYTTSFERYNYGKYLFLVISEEYETGGIRSNKWKDIYSIDAETERIVYLSEMFETGVKYEEAIISEITKQAEERNIELMGGNGLRRLPQKQSFYVKDGKLIIYFPPSEAAATVYGELSFEMPFTMNSKGMFDIK